MPDRRERIEQRVYEAISGAPDGVTTDFVDLCAMLWDVEPDNINDAIYWLESEVRIESEDGVYTTYDEPADDAPNPAMRRYLRK